ncbi:hypothetical protein KVR01_008364 [Diaporthe batatas]|uniref:uncharacterized protein n=1 Tax=Diaporthe batatas TaxID=748121 RepID=UPI001D045305|nr:uncharacterized protein KVR01_008364 [Diaporthe batatas]KAG8162599.1 hypothetical protein KVR01_008364 [Diaporthe batatas]
MPSSATLTTLSLLALSPLAALARTDLSGCTTFTSTVTINPTAHEYGNIYESLVYYDPDTLEICTVPDCGGGRAAPKTGVPGCPLYSGTATPTPSFLSADPLAPATTSGAAAETNSAGRSSGDSSVSTTTTAVVTAAETEPSWFASMTSAGALATGSSTTTEESSAEATSTPSSSVNSSSGAALRVTTGGLLFGLAISLLG